MREYQDLAIKRLIARLDTDPLLVSPTGSGKTPILAKLARILDLPVLMVAHRIELIKQAKKHMHIAGVRDYIVTSIQKQARHPLPNVGLILIDEAHHSTLFGQYACLFNQGIPVVGATATPFRRDGRGLGDIFGSLVVSAYPRELVNQGFLLEPTIYSHHQPDLSGVGIVGGEYNRRQLNAKVHKPKLMGDIVATWFKRADGLRSLGYAVKVQHSKDLAAAFRSHGVVAEHIDCKTPGEQRAEILQALADNEIQVVFNVGIATEGFDLPALDCVIDAAPTASLCLHLQKWGRPLRPEGQAIILDNAGNALRHGSPLRRINYTLEKDKKQQAHPLGLKLCPNCFLLVRVGVRICPDCGADLSPVASAARKVEDGDLVPFKDQEEVYLQLQAEDELKAKAKFRSLFGYAPLIIEGRFIYPIHENKRMVLRHLIHEQYRLRENKHWAQNQYKNFFKVWPIKFNDTRLEVMQERYENRKRDTK